MFLVQKSSAIIAAAMQRNARTKTASRIFPCTLLLLSLSVQLREGVADTGGDGDADLVVFSVKPSRWADNLYPPSELLALALRVNTGGPWEALLEFSNSNKNRVPFKSSAMEGGGSEEALYWLVPTYSGLFTVGVTVLAWPREANEVSFFRQVSFGVAAVNHRGDVGEEASSKRSGLAQCYSQRSAACKGNHSAGVLEEDACDLLLYKKAYSAPSVLTREELSLLSAFAPTWCGHDNDAPFRAHFPQRVALPPAPSLGACAFVEGSREKLDGLGLGAAIDAHDTVKTRIPNPNPESRILQS